MGNEERLMLVAIIFAIILVIVIPVGFLMSTSIVASTVGTLLTKRAQDAHAGSELVDLNT